MKPIPLDRTVHFIHTEPGGHLYHVWKNDEGGVTVQVGCHRSDLSRAEAKIIAGFLEEAASTNQENHAHHH